MAKKEKVLNRAPSPDITERKRMEELTRSRLDFEKTIYAVSSRFVSPPDIDDAINKSLADIGRFSGASRAYLFLFREDGVTADNTHEWCAEGISRQIDNNQNVPTETLWWMPNIRRSEMVQIEDVSQLPPEASVGKKILESQDIKSLLLSPVYDSSGHMFGFMGFDDVMAPRKWSDAACTILRMASVIIGNAISRKQAEEALRESEEFTSSLLNNAPNPIVVINSDTSLKYVNPALEKITGFASAALIGRKSPYPWWPKDESQRYSRHFEEAMRKRTSRVERLFRRENGEPFWVEISFASVIHNGQFKYHLANWVDITERKRMEQKLQEKNKQLDAQNQMLRDVNEELRATEEELRASNEELREAQERLIRAEKLAAIGQLASGVGHELRNPLAAIKNAIYYVRGKVVKSELVQKEPRVMEFLDIVDNEINSSNKIISDLLEFSRVSKLAVSPTSIEAVSEDALSHTTIPENIELTKKIEASLPEVEIDANQVRQVLVNILFNAVQAMPDGGKLTISARGKDKFLEVGIADTGCGIPREIIGKIFDPLFTTRARGIGLGLAVCKAIIEKHEGYIEVESEVGKGTTFTINLPLRA